MIDVAFVSCQPMMEHDSESRDVMERLARQGIQCQHWAWEDETLDWGSTRLAVVRSTWNYHFVFDAYLRWLEKVDNATRLLNPAALIRWNADKHYLRELEQAGVSVVPTHYVEPGESCDLSAFLDQWGELIIKPTVSAGAVNTMRVDRATEPAGTAHLNGLKDRALMLQPLMQAICTQGERSQIYIRGALSHVIDKVPAKNDFRIQEHFGGTYTRTEPRAVDLELAEATLAALDVVPLYARVDCVDDQEGQPRLMEIELIEPDLYLRHAPEGFETLTRAVLAAL